MTVGENGCRSCWDSLWDVVLCIVHTWSRPFPFLGSGRGFVYCFYFIPYFVHVLDLIASTFSRAHVGFLTAGWARDEGRTDLGPENA